MTLILSGTDGLSDIDGSAATPAIRGTDANTGIFFPAADTIAFAEGGVEAMRIDSAGSVGIGMTPVANYGLFQVGSSVTSAAGVSGLQAYIAGTNSALGQNGNISVVTTNAQAANIGGSIGFAGKYVAAGTTAVFAQIAGRKENSTDNNSAGYLQLATQPDGGTTTERARITSVGELLLGTTSVFSSGKQCISFTGGTVQGLNIRNDADNPADTFVGFYNAYGTKVGSITAGGSTTTYNTSSDYRLKENVQPLVNALDKVMALRPVSYTWKSGGEDNGFIAHELQLILPKAVSGEKDAVNEDDTINPQGVDYSKIVATLTAAIQEQQALITALTARIEALENK
jgi:hypothetical protein